MVFNFGTQQAAKPVFGAAAPTTGGSLFGTPSAFGSATTGASGFGASIGTGFGAASAAPQASSFGTGFGTGLGNSTTTTQSGFAGFGTTPSTGFGTAAGTGFGSGTAFGTSTGFGTGTAFGTTSGTTGSTTGFGLGSTGFGTTPGIGTPSTLGTGFGATAGFGTGIGTNTLGSGLGGNSAFGFANQQNVNTGVGSQQQQQQQQQQQANDAYQVAAAVTNPVIFNDERDAVIAKWNQLQAFWGTGKGFFNQQGASLEFTPDNVFCRFKAIGYSCLPKSKNKDGFVDIIFSKKLSEVQAHQSEIVMSLHKILGSKPNLSVCVEEERAIPDDKTNMTIYIQERAANGTTKRMLASEVFTYMNTPNIKQLLSTQLTITDVLPKTGFSNDQLQKYLENPPAGIDPLIWRQAKMDNPDQNQLIPVPMVGFSELRRRLKHQEQQASLHQARLSVIADDVQKLQQNHTDIQAKIEQYKRKQLELSHRVLQVMVRQEIQRKLGFAIQIDEEQLRIQLEAIQAELNAPTQFKGRLNELMSHIRMQNQVKANGVETSYQVDPEVQMEIKEHLKRQQEGIRLLINVVKEDMEDLELIENGLLENLRR